ncbi:MAG: carboxymuconolactone decarboxylase family protein [Natronincolaceae bacterium]|jgi:AhpD family alkylhydroperoxidase
MAIDHKKSLQELMDASAKLAEGCAGVMNSFGKLHSEAIKDDALPLRIKELIALGIAISLRCTGCIQTHVKKALESGVSREEIYETVGVAILMSGGPGTVYGSMAIEAMEQFSAE